MKAPIRVVLDEESVADLGYVKIYLNKLSDLMRRFPDAISGEEQRIYVQRSTELINKVSGEIRKSFLKKET